MADLLDVSPTRGTLLRLQDELDDMRDRYDLLERKREVLVQELMSRIEKVKSIEDDILDYFKAAHEATRLARMKIGTRKIHWVSLAPMVKYKVNVQPQTIMGLKIPDVDMEIEPYSPPYGLGDTGASLDEARARWIEVIKFLQEAAAPLTAISRIANEVRKTKRQVNALDSTIIPRYENTIHFIEGALEENEREDIIHAKKVKEMQRK